jgi:hypothetical protein
MDSDKTKDEYQRRQVEKRVRFEPRFRMIVGIGVPSIGCQLDVSAYDGEYLDQLSLSIAARTSGYYFNIFSRDEIHRRHATGADVVEFSPKDGRSTLMTYNVNYPGTAPKWDFGYNPKDPHDIMSIAEKIKDGTIAIRVGFWLDNEVVVYSGEKPTDLKPIEMFEQCINEHHIFDAPRHRTDLD